MLCLASLLFCSPIIVLAQVARTLTAVPVNSFWSLDPMTGAVLLGGHSHLKGETREQSAHHVRQWLIAYFSDWDEQSTGEANKLFFSARMRGLHPGVELKCVVGIKFEKNGFRYILSQLRIGAPNGAGTMFWHDLNRLLDDPDFHQDIEQFREELEQALPNL